MNAFTRKTMFALLANLSLVGFVSSSFASQPSALLLAPEPDYHLPKFGFSSFNINGYGERVTHVRWGGLASQIGLEPGDTILSMNGYRLNYHGAWSDALYRAMSDGGLVRLRIRDVRTGQVAFRQIYVGGGHGPVTPKAHFGGNEWHGPITMKSTPGAPNNYHGSINDMPQVNRLKQLVKLFDDND